MTFNGCIFFKITNRTLWAIQFFFFSFCFYINWELGTFFTLRSWQGALSNMVTKKEQIKSSVITLVSFEISTSFIAFNVCSTFDWQLSLTISFSLVITALSWLTNNPFSFNTISTHTEYWALSRDWSECGYLDIS